jgi:hypothetical protein
MQVPVACGNNPDIDANRARAAQISGMLPYRIAETLETCAELT